MRLPPIVSAVGLAMLLAFGLGSDASAAPQGLPDRKLDIELKAVDVKSVFRVLGEVAQKNVVLDPCVHGTVDVKLANVPLPLVFDALAMKLHLVYEENGGSITVRCAGDGGLADPANGARVSLSEKNVPLSEALGRLATAAKLDGVDYRATAQPKVDITLVGVRLSTALAALEDGTGLRIAIVQRRLAVTE